MFGVVPENYVNFPPADTNAFYALEDLSETGKILKIPCIYKTGFGAGSDTQFINLYQDADGYILIYDITGSCPSCNSRLYSQSAYNVIKNVVLRAERLFTKEDVRAKIEAVLRKCDDIDACDIDERLADFDVAII